MLKPLLGLLVKSKPGNAYYHKRIENFELYDLS